MATKNDLKQAAIAVNNALVSNNQQGVANALRNAGIQAMNTSVDLNKALLGLYLSDPNKWARVTKSIPFDYSSATPSTKSTFTNIITSLSPERQASSVPSNPSTNYGFTLPDWVNQAIGIIAGQTTVITSGVPSAVKSTPAWAWVAFVIIILAIVALVWKGETTPGL